MRIAPQPGQLNAPRSSHLEYFKLVYPPPGSRQSFEIEVAFRAKDRYPRAVYRYSVGDEATALAMMRNLRLQKSPGTVVHSTLERFPYRQIS